MSRTETSSPWWHLRWSGNLNKKKMKSSLFTMSYLWNRTTGGLHALWFLTTNRHFWFICSECKIKAYITILFKKWCRYANKLLVPAHRWLMEWWTRPVLGFGSRTRWVPSSWLVSRVAAARSSPRTWTRSAKEKFRTLTPWSCWLREIAEFRQTLQGGHDILAHTVCEARTDRLKNVALRNSFVLTSTRARKAFRSYEPRSRVSYSKLTYTVLSKKSRRQLAGRYLECSVIVLE